MATGSAVLLVTPHHSILSAPPQPMFENRHVQADTEATGERQFAATCMHW